VEKHVGTSLQTGIKTEPLVKGGDQLCGCRGNLVRIVAKLEANGTSLRVQRKQLFSPSSGFLSGTSLRVQRKRSLFKKDERNHGNISARAEETGGMSMSTGFGGEHLCACRGNGPTDYAGGPVAGTSLRVQRKQIKVGLLCLLKGNISARAEETSYRSRARHLNGEHLCACRGNPIG
jgi:hypothetical protein